MSWKVPRFTNNHYYAFFILILSVNASIGYMAWEAQGVEITELQIEGAPGGIVFIADPHLKESNLGHVRMVIGEINRLQPSVVLIGGDFVYGIDPDLGLQEVWREIDAPVYAVLGNHDYKAGIDATTGIEKVSALSGASLHPDCYDVACLRDSATDLAFADDVEAVLEANGVTVLRNEVVELDIEGARLVIVGVDDGWAGMANPPRLEPSGAFTVYMIHEPECRADWSCDLILAGHTHGGQFNSPVLQLANNAGIVELKGMQEGGTSPTYISRGIGTSNLDRELRFFCSPEIVVINPPSFNSGV
ncbi:MAG TPA: metallophosphoesterase [Methanoculleus sp.]|nr:metallophosphoesterase [Methanoculleus sp.]